MGGMERASCNIANALNNLNNEVLFLSIFKQERFFKLNEKIKFSEPKGDMNTKKLNMLKTILWIRKEVRKYNPDVVLVYNNFYSSIAMLALSGTHYPVFISDRASPLFNWPKHIKLFNAVVFRLFRPKGVIAQTNIAKQYQRRFFSKKVPIKVIPNMVREIKNYDLHKKNQVLAVGRLGDYLKGFDRLIDAFSLVKTDWKLVIAGGDENGEYLKKQARELNILNRIEFLGQVKDIDKIYTESKIFVIPSRSEGFPNALCEAMAAGLACISYDFIAGPRDIIENNIDGFIVEDGNLENLADKITYLINNSNIREEVGDKAKESIKKLKANNIANMTMRFLFEE